MATSSCEVRDMIFPTPEERERREETRCAKRTNPRPRVSVAEAARRMGVSRLFIQCGLREGKLPIGTAVKMSSRWTYYISEKRLQAYIEGNLHDLVHVVWKGEAPI